MCTSIVSNAGRVMVGWNLDILDMEHKVVAEQDKVYIAIHDPTEGWMPLFGANARGDFVAMPTCWPYDKRSDPVSADSRNIIALDIDLLLRRRTLAQILQIAKRESICSVPGVTFMAQLSDADGNVLQLVPGQGHRYLERPKYSVLTNFSPFKGTSEQHPWMGQDRYETAVSMLEAAPGDFGVQHCFAILQSTAQTVCPTVVSMVFDVAERTVYWCENRVWDSIQVSRMDA